MSLRLPPHQYVAYPALNGSDYTQGRYLPAFASYVYDQNQIAQAEGRETLNLASVLIGNGIVDIST